MRRHRTIIGVVAMLCVLLNTALAVRANASMVEARFQHASLLSALGIICHGSGTVASLPEGEQPSVPSPENTGDCPMCLGMCPSAAVLTHSEFAPRPISLNSERIQHIAEIIWARITYLRPPPRGPPAIV